MKLFVWLAPLLLTACNVGEKIQNGPITGEDVKLPPITWQIRTSEQLASTREKALGPHQGEVLGLSAVNVDTGEVIVMTTMPKYVDDEVACTLGHEVMHVALGAYHK